jgi:hypothetical protein
LFPLWCRATAALINQLSPVLGAAKSRREPAGGRTMPAVSYPQWRCGHRDGVGRTVWCAQAGKGASAWGVTRSARSATASTGRFLSCAPCAFASFRERNKTDGNRHFEESACSDSSRLDATNFKFDRDRGNFGRTTGLHRRRIQSMLGGHSEPKRSIPLPDGQPAAPEPGLPRRHGSIPPPAQDHAAHTQHRACGMSRVPSCSQFASVNLHP